MKKFSSIILAFWVVVFIPLDLISGGYKVNLQGAKTIAFGTITTMLNDVEAHTINASTLSFLENDFEIAVAAPYIIANTKFQSTDNTEEANINVERKIVYSLSAGYRINEKFSAGLSIYAPYGNVAEWDKGWSGEHLADKSSLSVIQYKPSVSYKITDQLSVGAGFIIASGSFEFSRPLGQYTKNNNGDLTKYKLEGSDLAYGFDVGLTYKTQKFKVSASYRPKIDITSNDGKATFSNIPQYAASSIQEKDKFSGTLPLAGQFYIGFRYEVNEKLSLATEFGYYQWNVFDSLKITFEKNTLLSASQARKWNNSITLKLAGQYAINDMLSVGAGVHYDQSPVEDEKYYAPDIPSFDYFGVSGGVIISPIKDKNFDITLALLHVYSPSEKKKSYTYEEPDFLNQTSHPATFEGKYKNTTYIPTIGLSYGL